MALLWARRRELSPRRIQEGVSKRPEVPERCGRVSLSDPNSPMHAPHGVQCPPCLPSPGVSACRACEAPASAEPAPPCRACDPLRRPTPTPPRPTRAAPPAYPPRRTHRRTQCPHRSHAFEREPLFTATLLSTVIGCPTLDFMPWSDPGRIRWRTGPAAARQRAGRRRVHCRLLKGPRCPDHPCFEGPAA